MSREADQHWMQHALNLAQRGRGWVEPNPLVGAVVVRENVLVGEGYHQRFGGPHAEVFALAAAGEAARGATLFVTLEPCCHHGKTPPCTEAILRAGVQRVVAAMPDPFAQVSGRGIAQLRAAGLEVEIGLAEQEARRLNAAYLKLLHTGKPYVHLKWAMTLDGKIATSIGDSKWISNEASRARVHALRGQMDGILVGIGTALADDPQLTARPAGARVAERIVLDTRARLPLTSHLVQSARDIPTLIATGPEADTQALRDHGCQILPLPLANGRVSVEALLSALGQRRVTHLLVEGGSEVLGSFLDARAVEEVHVFVAPRLIGGTEARSALGGFGVPYMKDSVQLREWTSESIGSDWYLHGWV